MLEICLLRCIIFSISDKHIRQQCDEILTGKFQSDTHVLRSCQENALAYLQLTDKNEQQQDK